MTGNSTVKPLGSVVVSAPKSMTPARKSGRRLESMIHAKFWRSGPETATPGRFCRILRNRHAPAKSEAAPLSPHKRHQSISDLLAVCVITWQVRGKVSLFVQKACDHYRAQRNCHDQPPGRTKRERRADEKDYSRRIHRMSNQPEQAPGDTSLLRSHLDPAD